MPFIKDLQLVALVALATILNPTFSTAQTKLVGVTDGDTIKTVYNGTQEVIELYGIDAPEKDQPYSKQSQQMLKALLMGRNLKVKGANTDRYGRTIAIVLADGIDINETMVANGLAWVYPQYCREDFCAVWEKLQATAKKNKQGLWAEKEPMPPWVWRTKKAEPVEANTLISQDSIESQVKNSLKTLDIKSVTVAGNKLLVISNEKKLTSLIYRSIMGALCMGVLYQPDSLHGIKEVQITNPWNDGFVFEGGEAECKEMNDMPIRDLELFILGKTHTI